MKSTNTSAKQDELTQKTTTYTTAMSMYRRLGRGLANVLFLYISSKVQLGKAQVFNLIDFSDRKSSQRYPHILGKGQRSSM